MTPVSSAKADLILHNGRVATQDQRRSFAAAAAIKDGKFLAVGTDQEVLAPSRSVSWPTSRCVCGLLLRPRGRDQGHRVGPHRRRGQGGVRGRGVRAAGPATAAGQPRLVAGRGVRRLPPNAARPRPPMRPPRPASPASPRLRRENTWAGRAPGAGWVAVRMLCVLNFLSREGAAIVPIILTMRD